MKKSSLEKFRLKIYLLTFLSFKVSIQLFVLTIIWKKLRGIFACVHKWTNKNLVYNLLIDWNEDDVSIFIYFYLDISPALCILAIIILEPFPPSRLRPAAFLAFPTLPFPASSRQLLASRPSVAVQKWFSKEMLNSSRTLWLAAVLSTL